MNIYKFCWGWDRKPGREEETLLKMFTQRLFTKVHLSVQAFIQALFYSRQTLVKTQSWTEFWNSISLSLFIYFFLYVCLEKPYTDFFIFLHHCYSYKPQIRTKRTGLTNRFVITGKNLCSCVQKIKNKKMVFFCFRLCYL